jgi:hypothetical protein
MLAKHAADDRKIASMGLARESRLISLLACEMRHNVDNAKLREVLIKSERLLDPEAIYDRIADAVGKTPFFVAKLFKDSPSSLDVGLADPSKLS